MRRMGKNMRRLTIHEFSEHYDRLFYLDQTVRELPWCNLRRHWQHEYPTLKVWPKWKSFAGAEGGLPSLALGTRSSGGP